MRFLHGVQLTELTGSLEQDYLGPKVQTLILLLSHMTMS